MSVELERLHVPKYRSVRSAEVCLGAAGHMSSPPLTPHT
ncbi:hypothetical protein RAJCM14343_4225 [Rhodococcus aetherivorans]|uniref:Mobile element protein n=1 Tax=Rhodococcus aetherivorans TaxID=191292 RepID=A0ABQ0YQU2_9NOCA|nr:hypothetical protein RAJCM14343_4225 [Rhodococcus aetherivorans]